MCLKEKFLNLEGFIDNEYLDFYCNLVEDNLHTEKQKYVTQKHHIIPRCYFKLKSLPENNSADNLINISYKNHLLLHYYLCLCTTGILNYKLKCAFFYLTGESKNLHNYIYNSDICDSSGIKNLLNKLDKYDSLYNSYCKERSEKQRGIRHPHTKACIDKIRKSNTGKKKMFKQDVETAVNQDKIDYMISQGWTLGSKPKIRRNLAGSTKGKIQVYLPNTRSKKYIDKESLDKYEEEGWVRGGLKPTLEQRNYIRKRILETRPKNTHWYNNGKIQVKRKKCPKGFTEGMLPSIKRPKSEEGKKAQKGKIIVNRNCIIKYICKEDLAKYEKEGWKRGRKFENKNSR